MKIIKKLCVIAGFLFIVGALVLSAVFSFTVGNAIALCFGALLIFTGSLFQKLTFRLRKLLIILTCIGIFIFSAIITVVVINGARPTVSFDEDCVLVLGCGIRGEELLPTLQARLDKCIEYLDKNPEIPVVVSGGQGPKEDITEAEAMKRYLLKNGVNEMQIIMEDKSRNTKENMIYSKQLLDSYFPGRIYITACITSDYHALRAKKTAKNSGLNVRSFNAGVKWYLRPSAYCREAISICKYWIFG